MVGGETLARTGDGFLRDAAQWSEAVAETLAAADNTLLTPAHWEIIRFIRAYYQRFQHLPNMRMFVGAVRRELGAEKGNSAYLHQLFPQGPLKYACKWAGLPKPPTCL